MWKYQEVTVTEPPSGSIGFVYKITNKEENRVYVGKKHLHKGKKWQNYWGSSEDLLLDLKRKGVESFDREIIRFCHTKIDLTYYEVHYQCLYSVLTTNSYNRSILGKFYKGRISA